MRAPGRPRSGPRRGHGRPRPPRREQKAPRGPGRAPGPENFARGRGPPPPTTAAERGKARPPRPRPPARTWWFSFLPPAAAAGPPGPLVMFTYRERVSGLRSVHILRASHTDARLRHSQPTSSLIRDRGRSLRSPPAPGRGAGAAATSGRRHPGPSHRAQLAHPAPAGPRRGWGGAGGARPSRLPLPFRPRNAASGGAGFHPEHVRAAVGRALAGARSLRPISGSGRPGGGAKGARIRLARAAQPRLCPAAPRNGGADVHFLGIPSEGGNWTPRSLRGGGRGNSAICSP